MLFFFTELLGPALRRLSGFFPKKNHLQRESGRVSKNLGKKFQLVFKVLVLRHFITVNFQKPFSQILIKSSIILNNFFLCATPQSTQKVRKSVWLEKAIHKFHLESAPASMLRSLSLTMKVR